MAKRIDSLTAGQQVTMKFHGSKRLGNESYELDLIFKGITGAGEDRRAKFDEVELYRYEGRWAYGTSAERATLV